MAKRFSSGFISDLGIEYNVEIWDSSFAGANTTFVLGGDGFTINEEGDADDPFKEIAGTSVNFTMQIQTANATAIATFITDLLTASEKRFQVLITKGATPANFWFGNILTDISMLHDRSPSAFEISATCGLGALAKIDYNNAGTAYTGSATLLEHAVNCLSKIGTFATFFTTEWCITTVVNWYEDSQATGGANDPFALTRNDHRTYYDTDGQGVKKYKSCFDVLQSVVGRMGARIFLSDGKFRIEQLSERDNVTIVERRYQKDGTYITNASISHDQATLNQTSEARLTAGTFDWLPAVREVKITYTSKNWVNHLAGASWTSASSAAFTISGLVHTGGNVTIRIMMGVFQSLQNIAYTGGATVAIIYRLKVKLGTKYMRRPVLSVFGNSVAYGPQDWVTAVSYYYFHREVSVPSVGTSHPVDTAFLDFVSTPLPESGDMEVTLDSYSIRRMDTGATVTFPDTVVLTWASQNPLLQVSSNGNAISDFADKTYTATATSGTNNSEIYEVETITGDGTTSNSLSRLQVYTGTAWVDSASWRVGTSGSWQDISILHVKEILALRQKNMRVYKGSIRGSGLAHSRWSFDGNFWILLEGTYTANFDIWDGTFVAVARDATNISSATALLEPKESFVLPPLPGITGTVGNNLGHILASATTASTLPTGAVTSITLTQSVLENAFLEGDTITLVNPVTGYTQNLTVSSNSPNGATAIAVSGYIADDFPPGSFIVVSPQNQTIQNYGSGGGTSASTEYPGNLTSILEFFDRFVRFDSTNEAQWPIEVINIVAETSETAGDGATEGIRFDGAGIKAFKSTSATATFYVLQTGGWELRSSGSTGVTGSGIIVGDGSGMRIFKSTSTTPVIYFNNNGTWDMRTLPDAGNGSVAGIKIDETNGLRAYKATSATPTIHLKADGTFLMDYGGHPTPALGLIYQYAGILFTADAAGTKMQPQLGYILHFNLFGYAENWSVTTCKEFFRFTSEYSAYEIYQIGFGFGSSLGSGTGNNYIEIKFRDDSAGTDTTILTIASTGAYNNNMTGITAVGIDQGDAIWFDCTAVKSTPAQGCTVDIYFRVP